MKNLRRLKRNEEKQIMKKLKDGDVERFELFKYIEFIKEQIKPNRLYSINIQYPEIGIWHDGKTLFTNSLGKIEKVLFMKDINYAKNIIEGVVNANFTR